MLVSLNKLGQHFFENSSLSCKLIEFIFNSLTNFNLTCVCVLQTN